MHLLIGISDPTTFLLFWLFGFKKGETNNFFIASLFFHFGVIKASSVDPWGSPCFQTIALEAQFNQLFGYSSSRFFCHPAPAKFLFSYMNNPVKEGAACY